MKKRLLAGLLTICLVVGLLPVSALAADPPSPNPQATPNEETATVDVEYGNTNRETATITYHKSGIAADPVNLIFLVDVAVTGRDSHGQFETMMRGSGLSYIYDYGVNSNTRLITYQNAVVDSGFLTQKENLLNAINGHSNPGEGNANEPAALKKAIEAVNEAPNDAPTVVFWVLGDHFGWKNETEIEEQVKALTEALGEDDALITWQLADKPNELLTQYATHHGDAHTPDADIVAAHVASDPVIFRDEMRADLEEVVHDHYHNINYSLRLADDQTVVSAIKRGYYESESGYVDLSATPTADGKGIDVHLEHVCRQADIDFVLEVELNPEVYETQTVIGEGHITAPADHSNGGLHTGIFDEGTLYGLTLHLPEVVIDRTGSTMTFQTGGAGGTAPAAIQQLVGTSVTIPDGSGLTNSGSSFGGWNVVSGPNQGTHYNAGQIIPMPSGDMTLEPAWGHVEVELELGDVTTPDPAGNQLAEDAVYQDYNNKGRLSFDGMITDSGVVIDNDDIINVSVIDQSVTYDKIVDAKDRYRVKLTSVSNAVYARHVGATEDDKVVAYLVQNQSKPGKYDLYIAGPGGAKAPSDISYMFSRSVFDSLETADVRALDTSAVTNMDNLFAFHQKLRTIDIRGWNTSQVISMSGTFAVGGGGVSYYSALEEVIGIEVLDVSNVVDMSHMFDGAGYTYDTGLPKHSLKDIDFSKWDTSSAEDMSYMFCNYGSISGSLDVSSFDTSKVTNMSGMFEYPYSNNFTSLTLGDKFKTSKVTDMSAMFNGCSGLTKLDLSNFNTSSVTSMSYMFNNCSGLAELDLSNFDTSSVMSMYYMFQNCSGLTSLTVGDNFDTSEVTSMEQMFSYCSGLIDLDVSKFDTSKVMNMNRMFAYCSGLIDLDVSKFDTSKVTDMGSMFQNCSSLSTLNLSSFDTSKVTNMDHMFYDCSGLDTLDVSSFDTSKVTNMSYMFSGCSNLSSLNLGDNFAISQVKDMVYPFLRCSNLETIEGALKLGETNVIGSFSQFFTGLKKLKSVTFDTPAGGTSFPNLSDMQLMFSGCSSLESIDLGNWTLPNLTNTSYMFSGCSALQNLNLSWSGMRAETGSFNSGSMFGSVSTDATLEIGNDTSENTQALMAKIADAFPGSVTINGAPRSAANSINELPLPEESETETEATPAPEGKPGEGQVTDGSEDTSDTPEEPADFPEDTQPSEEGGSTEATTPPAEPVIPDEPETTPEAPEDTQPSEEGGSTEGITPPAESVTPGVPETTPEAPEDIGEPEQTPAPSEESDTTPEAPQQPASPVETEKPETEAGSSTAALLTNNSVRSVNLTSQIPLANSDVSAQANKSGSIVVHDTATPAGSSFTYRVRVKYAGDTGAQSGRIELSFPLPEAVTQSADDTEIKVSDIEYSEGSSTGFKGGQIVVQPYLDKTDDDNPVLRGTFEGLYTGNEYEIEITCTNQAKAPGADGYTYWDAIAYTQDGAGSAVSNVYRLWNKDGGGEVTPPDPSDQHTLTYAFAGEVPPDAVLPAGGVYSLGNTVNIAAKPTSSYGYYEFSGWVRSDTQATVKPGTSDFSMPDNDVTLTGTWKINETSAPKITVTYEYTSDNEAQHVPNGAPDINPSQEVTVGDNHTIVQILKHADHHIFGGWKPTLTIGDQVITLSDPDSDGVYTGSDNGTTYSIHTSGLLYTEQFRSASGAVTVAFKGAWRPYTGRIQFDANGGEGTMSAMQNVTWDTKTQYLPENQFTYPADGFTFTGWATSPSGKVVKKDKELADGLIDEDGKDVTLYAVWKRTSFEVGYDLSHVSSTNTEKTVALGGSYETILSPASGYEMKNVSIKMGGAELASNASVYNPATGQVNISNISGDIIIRATAEAKTEPPTPTKHTITVTVTGGTASPSGSVQVEDGKDQTITFAPNAGYVLGSVTVDGASASLTGNSYTFTNVTSDHSISVVYQKDGGSGGGGGTVTDKYPIYVESTGNGTAASDKQEAAKGEVVTIDTNGEVISITVLDKDGNEISVTDRGDGSFTFKMPNSAATVKVEFEPLPDVADPNDTGVADWLNTNDHISYLSGYPDGSFRPGNNMTRAEVAQMFYNLLLDKDVAITVSFKDVKKDSWYETAVHTLASLGIITGIGNDQFAPERAITRAEFTAIAMRFAKLDTTGINIFSDVTENDWFYDYVVGSIQYGWITGYEDGTFRPNHTISRAEVTTITNRMLGRSADESYVDNHSSEIRVFPDVTNTHWAYYQIVEATNSHDFVKTDGVENWKDLN